MAKNPDSVLKLAEAMGCAAAESMRPNVDNGLINEAQEAMTRAIGLIVEAHGGKP